MPSVRTFSEFVVFAHMPQQPAMQAAKAKASGRARIAGSIARLLAAVKGSDVGGYNIVLSAFSQATWPSGRPADDIH